MSLAENIKKFREEKGLTQGELGNHVGMSQSMINFYEHGFRSPNANVLGRMADLFECSLDELMGKKTG